jgi:protein-disulfide isomerase
MKYSYFRCMAPMSLVFLTLSTSACTAKKPSSGASDMGAASKVATLEGSSVSLGEVDEAIKAQLSDLEEQKYQLRRQGLDRLINQRLVQAAAKKAGLSEDEFMKKEVESKVTPPSEDKITEFFNQNAAQLPPGSKMEDYKERIVSFMTRQQRESASQELFDRLRKEAKVEVTLKAPAKPRVEVAAVGPVQGDAKAPVTIVEFSDFECPFCSRARDTIDSVVKAYPGKVKLVFRQFPLEFHQNARKAAEAALCAHEQNKFWEYHDTLFKSQKDLGVESLKNYAKSLSLDSAKFDACLDSGKHASTVQTDMEAGQKAGVSGTPAFFINGIMLSGAQPVEEFKRIIDEELKTH